MKFTRIVHALHKHVPLIKFLGPRSKLSPKDHGQVTPVIHPAISQAKSTNNLKAREETKATGQAQQPEFINYSELPEKYKRKGPTPDEIAAIELGGADFIIRLPYYEMLTRAINVLKYQEERTREDIETLKRRKKEALEDPITFAEQLRDGTNERLPARQIVFACPKINWNKYRNSSPQNNGNLKLRFSPYGTKKKAKTPIRPRSKLMDIVLKGAAEIGLHPQATRVEEGSDEESELNNLPATETNFHDDLQGSQTASSNGKGAGKKMLSALLAPAEILHDGAKKVEHQFSTGAVNSDIGDLGFSNSANDDIHDKNNFESIVSSNHGISSITTPPQNVNHISETSKDGASKPHNHNVPWTDEEQKRLMELLAIYPEEEIQSHRFKKISSALGTRTPKQVASRVQKYFIKLAKHGLPVPGRIPNLQLMLLNSSANLTRTKKASRIAKTRTPKPSTGQTPRRPRVSGIAYEQAQPPPTVYMPEGDDESIVEKMLFSANYIDPSPDPKEPSNWIAEMPKQNSNVHFGFSCDSCQIDPIIGNRYQCLECEESRQVDLCEDCMDQANFENEHHKALHRFSKIASCVMTFDSEKNYINEHLGEYSYLGAASFNDI
ncbi:hypothetical protein G9A89_013396 [Geosiphon pyriformis]|nr:hypothetical protein G9A89_013396 [Geosiphon pyriformis]